MKKFRRIMLLTVATALPVGLFLFLTYLQTTNYRLQTNHCNSFDCWADYYKKLTSQKGVGAALGDLQQRSQNDLTTKKRCHWMAHAIGWTGAQTADRSDAFSRGDHTCEGGFYHGFMEALAAQGRSGAFAFAQGLCPHSGTKRTEVLLEYNCYHGIGHGVMALHDDNLPIALHDCDRLEAPQQQSACWSGVFMQNIITDDGDNHRTSYLKTDDLLYPCTAVEEKYQYDCYLMQSPYILRQTGLNTTAALHACLNAETDFQTVCAQGLGRDIAAAASRNHPAILAACLAAPTDRLKAGCIVGALKDIIAATESKSAAEAFCASAPQEFQLACTAAIRHSPTLSRSN